MSNPTSNFGWQMPTPVDLVTDLPADFEVFGQAVDSTLADLKGGTSGQVLSKNSNTDMDFVWTSPNPGDITGVTAGTGITGGGTSGDVTVSFDQVNFGGGQFAAGKNKIINGDFSVNQRSFSSTTTSAEYNFDRWRTIYSGGTSTTTAQTFTPGTAPVSGYEGKNFYRVAITGQSGVNDFVRVQEQIESVRTLAGQTATISFWAKASTGTPKIAINMVQTFGGGGSPSAGVDIPSGTVTTSTSWARYSLTVAIPSISGKTFGTAPDDALSLRMMLSGGSSVTAAQSIGIQNVTFDIWGVQIEAGSIATPFQTATGTIQGETSACQRYYWRNTAGAAFGTFAGGFATTTTGTTFFVNNPVPMRVTPTALDFANLNVSDYVGISNSVSAAALVASESTALVVRIDATTTGLTQYRPYGLRANNNTAAFIGLSAEL